MTRTTYFRKGFGLKAEVRPQIQREFGSALVEHLRSQGYFGSFGDVTVHVAKKFGFCYGVDRAVDYAYEARVKFPNRRIFLVGEIIHNPHVNRRLTEMGIRFIFPGDDGRFDFSDVSEDDVVIIPAFGVRLSDMATLRKIGCILVDTTCGSVLLVWKRVKSYAKDGFTVVLHGKHHHEESKATVSQVERYEDSHYLILRTLEEADLVGAYAAGEEGAPNRENFMELFQDRVSPGFDPDHHLARIGIANQTTMLANESLEVGRRIQKKLVDHKGKAYADENFRAIDTICSATQTRQDAVEELLENENLDAMIVLGGYNSSNTNHLAHICRQSVPTYHIADASCIDPGSGTVRHKPGLDPECPEEVASNWLPSRPVQLGITAGASSPNNMIGLALLNVFAARDIDISDVLPEEAGRQEKVAVGTCQWIWDEKPSRISVAHSPFRRFRRRPGASDRL